MENEAKEIIAKKTENHSFEDIYLQYKSAVRAIVYRIAGAADLDDLVQEVFVKIWKTLPCFRGQSSLKTWVSRIAVNTSLDYCRRRSRLWKTYEIHEAQIRSTASQAESDPQEVLKAMQQLSSWHRSLIVLNCFESYNQSEIAELLEISVGRVKSGLFEAKKELKVKLQKQGFEF